MPLPCGWASISDWSATGSAAREAIGDDPRAVDRGARLATVREAFDRAGVCFGPYQTIRELLENDPEASTQNPLFTVQRAARHRPLPDAGVAAVLLGARRTWMRGRRPGSARIPTNCSRQCSGCRRPRSAGCTMRAWSRVRERPMPRSGASRHRGRATHPISTMTQDCRNDHDRSDRSAALHAPTEIAGPWFEDFRARPGVRCAGGHDHRRPGGASTRRCSAIGCACRSITTRAAPISGDARRSRIRCSRSTSPSASRPGPRSASRPTCSTAGCCCSDRCCLGDTLHTRTRVVGLRQNRVQAGRAATGIVALEMTTHQPARRDGAAFLALPDDPLPRCRRRQRGTPMTSTRSGTARASKTCEQALPHGLVAGGSPRTGSACARTGIRAGPGIPRRSARHGDLARPNWCACR